jgi:type IV secretory pathway TrbF-like protein
MLDLFKFILKRRKFFLLPVLLSLFILGGLLFLSEQSAIAPFVYALF